MIILNFFKVLIVSSMLLLTACADRADITRGIGVDIVPIQHTLSLNLKKNKAMNAQHRLKAFLVEQHERILSGHVDIFVATDRAYKLALQAESQLHAQGVDAKTIRVKWVNEPLNQRFDYVIQVTDHQVTVPICRPAQSGYFFHRNLGCATDTIRWKSMVRPDAILNQSAMDARPSKAL